MIRFKQLPNWCITNILPGFYDFESLTAIEQTGRLYSTLQSLIEDYNKFANEVNTCVNEFMESTSKNEEEFVCKINKIMHDYIMVIDEKIKLQDSEIAKAIDYMKTNLADTLHEVLVEMRESGELGEIVLETFDAFTSRLVALETKIPTIETDISNLKQKTSDIEGNIVDIENELSEVGNRFIPSKTSEIENDSDFVNSDYVQQEIATFDFIKVVESLPTEGLENRVYLVPKADTQSQDLFDEYVWINGKWEWITTKQIEVDLTPYYKKTETYSNTEIDNRLSGDILYNNETGTASNITINSLSNYRFIEIELRYWEIKFPLIKIPVNMDIDYIFSFHTSDSGFLRGYIKLSGTSIIRNGTKITTISSSTNNTVDESNVCITKVVGYK